MKVFAHRGASAYAPENTMAAFLLAKEQGAHGIELDIQRTKDDYIVVAHDFTVDRVSNGSGPIADKTFAELRALDFGGWFGEKFAGEKIPTLEEVLAFLSESDMMLNIEIKSDPKQYDTQLVRQTAKIIAESGLSDRIIVSSFDHRAIVEIKSLCDVKTGILYASAMVNVWDYAASVGAEYIHPLYASLVEEFVTGCHRHGIGVNAWTVDSEADVLRMLHIGTDVVITNKPREVLAFLQENAASKRL